MYHFGEQNGTELNEQNNQAERRSYLGLTDEDLLIRSFRSILYRSVPDFATTPIIFSLFPLLVAIETEEEAQGSPSGDVLCAPSDTRPSGFC